MGQGEKRKHPRLDVQIPVRYRETFGSGPGSYRGAQTRDISAGGLRFQTESFIALNTPMIFEIHLPSSAKPVRAISAVAWTRALPSGIRYEVGSRFTEIIPSERTLLESFLAESAPGRS